MNEKYSKVIVIGAGIAGLKATIELSKAGISTTIIEARNRLGGRLLSEKTPSGKTIDIGASWFHDCLTNPLLKKYYSHENTGSKVEFGFDDSGMSVYDINGEIDSAALQIDPVVKEIEMYLKYIVGSRPAQNDISLKDACLEYLKSKEYILTEEQMRLSHQIIRFYELWIGSSWEDISARNIVAEDHKGRDALVLNGYKSVYDGELQELLHIIGKTTVDEIYGKNNSLVSININNEVYKISKNFITNKIEVLSKQSDKELFKFTCDYLIVTAPLSILSLTDPTEKGCITWSPPLPPTIRSCLDATSFSHLGKVFMEFPTEFWPQKDRLLACADQDESFLKSLNIKEDVSDNIKVKGKLESPVLFINVSNILRKKDIKFSNPLILCLVSEHLTKKLELCYRNKDTNGIMKLLNPPLSRISNVPVEKIPKPTFVRVTEWSFDEYARGSYTGLPVASDIDFPEIVDTLVNPKGIFGETGSSRVRFAGEGIIDDGNGCAHAAWATGEREAQIIIKSINKAKF